MKRNHRAVIGGVAVCTAMSLIASPAFAAEPPAPDDVSYSEAANLQAVTAAEPTPETVLPRLTTAEMQAFVDAEPGSEFPDQWTTDSSASYVVTEQLMSTDPLRLSNPYDSGPDSGTGPVGPTVVGTAAAPSPAYAGAPVFCRALQDPPHRSSSVARRINTHMTGRCPIKPDFHSIAGATYRQMWFGWLLQVAVVDVTSKVQMKINLPLRCHNGSYERYRSFGRYYAVFSHGYKGVTYRTTTANAPCY